MPDLPGYKCARAAAEPQPQKKYGKNDGERVNRSAEKQRQQACPNDLTTESRRSGNADRDVYPGGAADPCRTGSASAFFDILVTRARSQNKSGGSNRQVDCDCSVCGYRHVINAEQVESGEQGSGHGASNVRAVEEAERRDSFRRGFEPPCDRRKRTAHQ